MVDSVMVDIESVTVANGRVLLCRMERIMVENRRCHYTEWKAVL